MTSGRLAVIAAVAAPLALAAGHLGAGSRLGALAALVCLGGWGLALRSGDSAAPGACLLASIAVATWGVVAGAPGALMQLAALASLVAWDLALFRRERREARGLQGRALERAHLRALLTGSLPGLGLGLTLAAFPVRLPALVVMGLAVAAYVALIRAGRAWRSPDRSRGAPAA